MPTFKVPDGEIYYEVPGSGYPLMIFAPGGLRSELSFGRHSWGASEGRVSTHAWPHCSLN